MRNTGVTKANYLRWAKIDPEERRIKMRTLAKLRWSKATPEDKKKAGKWLTKGRLLKQALTG